MGRLVDAAGFEPALGRQAATYVRAETQKTSLCSLEVQREAGIHQ